MVGLRIGRLCCFLVCASDYGGVDRAVITGAGMRATVQGRRTEALCCAVVLAGVLAGCGGSGGDAKPAASSSASAQPSAPGTSTAASPDPEAADEAKVLAVYRAMTEAEAEAYRMGTDKGTGLERYATLDALGRTRLDLARMKEAGTVVRGEVGHDPKVTSLDLEAKTPRRSCQTASTCRSTRRTTCGRRR
ncbi:hypothetical protein ACQPXT_01240 [Streptomyces sp. CA-100214]